MSKEVLKKLYNRTLYVHDLLVDIHDALIQYPLTADNFIAFRTKLKKAKLVSNNFLVTEINEVDNWLAYCSTEHFQLSAAIKSCNDFITKIDDLLACFDADAFSE